jgi:hypothetical protein
MLMQPTSQRPETKPTMPEVSRNGHHYSVPIVQWERMGASAKSSVRAMRREGVSMRPRAEIWKMQPNPLRFYLGAVAIGFGAGICWTILFTTPPLSRHLSHAHAFAILWSIVILCYLAQAAVLISEHIRMQRKLEDLKAYDREYCDQGGYEPKDGDERHL